MPVKIMIVDDEPITRMDIKEIMEENGYKVIAEGRNGDEAIEKAYHLKPDLIIMDVKIPKINGIKTSSIIKSFSDCAILLLTAYSNHELIEQAKNADINAYLVKPVKECELLPTVEMVLNQNKKIQTLQKKIISLERKMKERKIIEKAKGLLEKNLLCSEEEAYRIMQKRSMDRQIPLIKIALQIIHEYK